MKLTSASGSEINLEALYQICPSCFTEVKDEKTGELAHKINFSTLRELLGDNAFEGADEEYGFNWVGKNAARREAARVITKTLRPCPEESVDWENTQNLYIEGDNLEVLKLLQKSYLGKIKMIYIDPPYNTGNDFVYKDDFERSSFEEELTSGNIDNDNNRFRKNIDGSARFHSVWCSMIYERLLVARTLLASDGVIFISIDDNEIRNLKNICDEVFGAKNFIDIFNWAKTETPENLSVKSRQIIEYVLCYQKNKDNTRFLGVQKYSSSSNGLLNQPNPVGILKFPANKVITKISDGVIKAGMYGTDKYDVELLNDTEVKGGVFVTEFSLKAKFKWQQSYLDNEIANGTTISIPTIKFSPAYEKQEYAPEVPTNLINSKVGVDTNENAGEYQLELFDKKVFNFPKPVSLIKYLLKFLPFEGDCIVLDFFSGSGTTAEAVMSLNSDMSVKNPNYRYILVQIQEDLHKTLKETTSKSQQEIIQNAIGLLNEMDKPKNICELGKERIRRAGKKIKEEGGLQAQNLDVGFRVFKCEDSFMNDVYFSPAELKQEDLFSQVENIKDGTSDLSMLFGCMLDWGVQLSLPLSDFTVSGKRVYNVNDGDLVACFAEDVNEDVISAIAELSPLRVVFRDSCFKEAAFKMNLFELFKQKCGWSEEQVKSRVHVI